MHHLNLVIDPLNKKLMLIRSHTPIGMNPIMTQNNTIITLHLDNEENGSERLAPYGELHGDVAYGPHQAAPMPFSVKLVFTSSPTSLPSFLSMEYDIRLMAVPLSTSILEISIPSM
jgi:hypothetical protein